MALPNKALKLNANSSFQLRFDSVLASTLGASATSAALLSAAERPVRWAAGAEEPMFGFGRKQLTEAQLEWLILRAGWYGRALMESENRPVQGAELTCSSQANRTPRRVQADQD